ncbi:MAG: hypothetical protein FWE88_08830 [Phycisphaerae bacterium]|nr:hypothetical protein [Phycisphaerae bacterium]
MVREVVITGIGMLTPLGASPAEVLERVERGESAVRRPAFDMSSMACTGYAPITGFEPERHIDDGKSVRLMNRDAQLAVAAARLALADANVRPDETYASEAIALYGATGMTGMPVEEVAALVRHSADAEGTLDLRQFGRVALKRVRPVLSFKMLASMPICFVSIHEKLRGENGIYTPWEGQGASAIVAGIRAVQEGVSACALVGGCDVRTHEFAFVSLEQLGALRSWSDHGEGSVPGEGAAFLVLEDQQHAQARGARMYARVVHHALGTIWRQSPAVDTFTALIGGAGPQTIRHVVAAGDGDRAIRLAEREAMRRASLTAAAQAAVVYPKRSLGNLYAAAAAVQAGLAATIALRTGCGQRVLANCFGHGSGQGVFVLEGLSSRDAGILPACREGVSPSPNAACRQNIPYGQSDAGGPPAGHAGKMPASRECARSAPALRIVITGIGVVSPVGCGREAFWRGLVAGRSGLGPITLFDASAFPVRIGGEVRDFDAARVSREFPQAARCRDRKVLLGLKAAADAMADSGLEAARFGLASLHVGVGLEMLCMEDLTPFAQAGERDDDPIHAMRQAIVSRLPAALGERLLQTPLDTTAEILGEHYGFLGGRFTNCSACAAGAQSVGEAFLRLRRGEAELALAGATDSMLNPLGLGGFGLLRVLSAENETPHRACRPFDASRTGTALGEGAAFVVLETLDRALARGARCYAEILGYGSSMDGFRVSDPEPNGRGAVRSMTAALADAELGPGQIDCVSAHGTGTPKNDVVETGAIKEALGPRAYEVPVHALKSMTGHMIAASGAVEAVAAALTIRERTVPPTIHLERPDPACDLDYVPNTARPFEGRTVLSNSFGFGGQNATLIFGRCP